MKNYNGFTLAEILLALGIFSIATVFIINGIYNIEVFSNENQQSSEMDKVLQISMETVLSEKKIIASGSYFYENYQVEIILHPYQNSGLFTLQLIVTNSSGDSVKAGVVYSPRGQ